MVQRAEKGDGRRDDVVVCRVNDMRCVIWIELFTMLPKRQSVNLVNLVDLTCPLINRIKRDTASWDQFGQENACSSTLE